MKKIKYTLPHTFSAMNIIMFSQFLNYRHGQERDTKIKLRLYGPYNPSNIT